MTISYKSQLKYKDYQDLTDQIRFLSLEGKIWLGEQRMLLMAVSAMAAFRREMVNTMGVERATSPACGMPSWHATFALTAMRSIFFWQVPSSTP